MAEREKPTIKSRPLFAGHEMPPEERERKFRQFVKFVIENQERAGTPLPADHPLRDWLPVADAA